MNYEQAYTILMEPIIEQWGNVYPETPIKFQNRDTVDLERQVTPFLGVVVDFNNAEQVSMEATPLVRTYGDLIFTFYVKVGEGVRLAHNRLAYLANLYRPQTLKGVVLTAPKPLPGATYKGWMSYSIRVPFWFD